ncbi:uncharacterized protein N7459_009574 [Penicillium hispanicum]|uniref:uncharacterized protein n=1 Tax=Penicillium hispanicum TaxID=1080232 RepID=UPI0025425168|nr:uncharacterized protein N7459_009574 [Penicillium hispanicum]KAJ5570144.1 hypothetical protein N7459_009574 [Penicillium hispanicum]
MAIQLYRPPYRSPALKEKNRHPAIPVRGKVYARDNVEKAQTAVQHDRLAFFLGIWRFQLSPPGQWTSGILSRAESAWTYKYPPQIRHTLLSILDTLLFC